MIEAFKQAMANAAAAEASGAPSKKESVDLMRVARDAVRQVMLAADSEPELLTAAGLPRLPAVRAAYDMLCDEQHVDAELKVTTDLVGTLFLEIQEESKPAPQAESATRYPGGVPEGDLGDEEVGGDVEATLSRVAEQE
jgi:hypothetical protein